MEPAAFVQMRPSTPLSPATPVAPALAQAPVAAGSAANSQAAVGSAGTAAIPAVAALAGAAVACRSSRKARRTACQAAAVKKKGVRVVEGKEIPWNLFAPKSPYKAEVVSNELITTETPLVNWQTTHIVIDHAGKVPYIEGQSIGVIAPGPDKKGETPAKVRLYSIASSAAGDDETSKTVSLVVKKVTEVSGRGWCEYSNVEPGTDPEFPDAEKVYRGVCSTHIHDLKAGDDCLITGPIGAEMLLPDDPEANIIMMATGTGIAPFRSYLRKLFHDKATRIPRGKISSLLNGKGKFSGLAWLFLGVPYENSLLYDEEWKEMKSYYPDNFRYDYAISEEQQNKEGKPCWVQHRVMEYVDELWPMLKEKKTHVYMCGLKGMERGFEEAFGDKAAAEGLEWTAFIKSLKAEKRYHVEVY